MVELVIKILIFILLGMVAWWAAKRFPMPEHRYQTVDKFDRWYFMVALLLAGTVSELFGFLAVQPLALKVMVQSWSVVTQMAVYLLTTDFLGYWVHRLMHTKQLWSVHALHHDARSLNWLSGMKGSPLHMVFVVAPGVLMATFFVLTENAIVPWILMSIEVTSQHFTHSNVRLPFVRQLEWLIVTPRMHFVHHNRDAAYSHANYGFYFSVWDHLFGTYVDADTVPNVDRLGLQENYTKASLFLGVKLVETPMSS